MFLLEKKAPSRYTELVENELAEFADLLHVSGCPVPWIDGQKERSVSALSL